MTSYYLPSAVELCAGAGGQAIGLERAGFAHEALFEIDASACDTLRLNRPNWNVIEHDLFAPYDFAKYRGIDLLAGGLPCPPFSIAGKQLGEDDERNLFSRGIDIVDVVRPRAVMFENVKGMLGAVFASYRNRITRRLERMGYTVEWKLLHASTFGVPQLRPRVVMVAVDSKSVPFVWPDAGRPANTVGHTLFELMSAGGWKGAKEWRDRANTIAPTIVGGSKKHGGPDLGPTRARAAWAQLGVNGSSIAEFPPAPGFEGNPRLTVPMVARIQGFPEDWFFKGGKTAAYRQVGNAFPPPVAEAVGRSVLGSLGATASSAVMVGT